MKGALFCDIDGTLIPYGQKAMKPSLLETLKEAIRRGWMLCFATGRAWASVTQALPMFQDDAYFICSSGTCMYYRGKEVLPSLFLDRMTVERIIAYAKEQSCSLVFSLPEGMYSIGELDAYTDNLFASQYTSPKPVVNIDQFDYTRIVVCTLQFPHDPPLPVDDLRAAWKGKLFWEQGGPRLVDGCRANKGTALQRALEAFHIPRSRSYAFGDYDNDLPMLRAAGTGYLMADTSRKLLLGQFPNHCHDIEQTIRDILSEG